jgi:NitT/TauT family transport system permease protein
MQGSETTVDPPARAAADGLESAAHPLPPRELARERGTWLGGWIDARRGQQLLSLGLLVLAWWVLSFFFPPFLVPRLPAIWNSIVATVSDPQALQSAGTTYGRILIGLVGGFVIGAALGLAMALNKWTERSLEPFVRFLQGVPALSWVVFAVIWFKETEQRVLFVLIVNTLPAFAIQVHDGVKAIPGELWDMVRAWRPTRLMLIRKLVLPGVLPHVLTAWKVNLGNATRVVIVAERVGATVGVGYQLRLAQERFVMADAVTWTLALVLFAYVSEWVLALVERRVLRYRPALEG